MMKKKFYNLTVICEGAMPDFTVDEQTLASFEKSFDSGEGIIKFIDKEDNGEVRLRNKKLAGYKKTQMNHVPSELKDK
ncbi:MAG TPA: hypothetical protein DDW94_11190 [Deltaproteobacteria bacterium]|nr:MAG: hypothetical protein A2Z79_04750 [Deltaproteobacteria bacterium GWA2_55_82]OIJ72634.1 MAG: hypothetical protein A2V21_312320 [Deltaproteobacteria bacterium GWC2_55_46]HBG47535.1 hypothetical protein [Deltaproteobacteria bacterium]HCY10446.1 hypothetical protein [Deltaproteobacteria bacterium]